MRKTLFLPGAGGSAAFWKPVAAHADLDGAFVSWPGLGDEPPDPAVGCIDDLVSLAAGQIREPTALIAQSMGGYVAIRLALAFPTLVRSLVLAVTSGGVPVAGLGGCDWRSDYASAFPNAATWIADPVDDLSARIPSIPAPALLLWGDADPISPVAVGKRLASLLPRSRLRIIPGAGHDLAQTHAEIVAAEIRCHLAAMPSER